MILQVVSSRQIMAKLDDDDDDEDEVICGFLPGQLYPTYNWGCIS